MTVRGALMVCGTASDVGKSRLVAGLCRAIALRGSTVAPFKAQNMSLNSTVTRAGHEIARAQAHQAAAAGVEAEVDMAPVLLKPTGERTSQLVVMGRPTGEVNLGGGWSPGTLLAEVVLPALGRLRARFDVVLAEGAGGCAETNLLARDIANLPLAAAAGMPAVLVGDIERGGVFASIYGSFALLPDHLRRQLRGFVVNKFRGDRSLLVPGLLDLERRTGMPCLGVLPHLGGPWLDEEDSLALASMRGLHGTGHGALDIAVVALPHMSNFTDFDPLVREPGVALRYASVPSSLGAPDLVVLPGTKATVADLAWLRAGGWDIALDRARGKGSSVLGICGGYQMLGAEIDDDVESKVGHTPGLGLLPVCTSFRAEKTTRWREGETAESRAVTGYEIRHGCPVPSQGATPWFSGAGGEDGIADAAEGLWATSWHGIFENDGFRAGFLGAVASRAAKPYRPSGLVYAGERERAIVSVADAVEAHLDMDALCGLISAGSPAAEPGS